MSDEGASIDHWEAIAREHGGVIAFLRSDEKDENGEPLIEAMVLRVKEEEALLSFHLTDADGSERICLLVRPEDLEKARQEGREVED